LKKSEFNYKDPVTIFILAYGLIFASGPWLLLPVYLGLLGLPFVAAAAVKWGTGAGLAASFWAGSIVFLAFGLAGNITINVIISVLFYFIIAIFMGLGMQALRKRKQRLQVEKKYYEDLLNSTHDPLHVIDKNLIITFANNRVLEWLKRYGLDDAIVGKPILKAMPFLSDRVVEEYRRVFATGEALVTEESTDLGGAIHHTETMKTPVFDLDGSVTSVITAIKDITARKEAEKNMINLVENSPDMIVRFNRKLQHIYCNEAVTRHSEAPKEFFLGKSFLDLSNDPDNMEEPLRSMHRTLLKCFETAEEQEVNQSFHVPGGKKHFQTRVVPELGNDGEVESLLAVSRDVTELVSAKEKLDQFNTEYETVFHGTRSAMFLLEIGEGEEFRFVRNNEAHQRVTGFRTEELRGQTPYELLGEDIGEAVLANYRRCYEFAAPISYEETLPISGEERTFYTSLTPAAGPDGEVTHIVGSSEDITSRNEMLKALRESEVKFRSIVEAAKAVSLVVTDLDSVVQEFSPGAEAIFGYTKEEIIGKHVGPLHHASEVKKFASYIERLKTEKRGFTFETRLFRKNGEPFPALFTLEPLFNYEGEVTGTLGISVDISELKETEEKLRLSEQKFRSYIDHAPDGVFVSDDKGMLKEANAMASLITGHSRNELIGKYIYELIPAMYRQFASEHYKQVDEKGRAYGEMPFVRKDGENRFWSISTVKLSAKEYLAFCRDITERKQAEEKIRYLSYYDNLTGLHNRLYLEEEMKRLDTGRQLPISVIMVDLNGLKLVNDTYGHDFGDKMLRDAAEVLRCSCRSEDIIARWGGDEFVILLPQTKREETEGIYRRIKGLTASVYIENVPLSMAMGLAVKEKPEQELSNVLNQAEKDMYRKKLAESRSEKSAILDTLLKALGEKCYETEEHIGRMQEIASGIGNYLELPEAEMNRLALAVKLHDIGKTSISEDLLSRAGPLNQEEWDIIKKHPATGYRIARTAEAFSHVAEDILAHHENWDGSGYPQGLKGEEIPLLARIVAIADAYEVMTAGRPYREPLSQTEALSELKNCSGSQFDPELVEIFIAIIDELQDKGTGPCPTILFHNTTG